MVKFKSLDFSPLQVIDLNYASQTSVPTDKADMFLACDIHYKFDLLSIIKYTGGNYTAAHQDVDDIVATITSDGCNKSLVNKTYYHHQIIATVLNAINNETKYSRQLPWRFLF